MPSPYIIAMGAIYWKFPSEAERLAVAPLASEVNRLAWQESDNSLHILIDIAPTWTMLSIPSNGKVNNVVASPLTIEEDKSYSVVSYLTIDSDLIVDGNVEVIG
jgi:hypothetical protein